MDINAYLSDKERRFNKTSERVKDLRVFDFNYIPEQPLMRDELKPGRKTKLPSPEICLFSGKIHCT